MAIFIEPNREIHFSNVSRLITRIFFCVKRERSTKHDREHGTMLIIRKRTHSLCLFLLLLLPSSIRFILI